MSGWQMMLRHIDLLPDEERLALLSLIAGAPYDEYHAKRGARRLWGRGMVPSFGFEELI